MAWLSRAMRCLGRFGVWIVRTLKRYLEWAISCGVVLGILIASPLWPKSVRLEAQNPLVIVDMESFAGVLKDGITGGLFTQFTMEEFNKSANIDLTLAGKILFYKGRLPVRYKPYAPKESYKPPELEFEAGYERLAMDITRQSKEALGYVDDDTRGVDYRGFAYESNNFFTREEMASNPFVLSLAIAWRCASTNIGLGYGNACPDDPFYKLLERETHLAKRSQLYGLLSRATEIVSCFTLINEGYHDVYDLRVTANLSRYEQYTIEQCVLDSYDIAIENTNKWSTNFRVGNLRPGKMEYKLIVIRSKSGAIKPEDVRLDKKAIVEEIADHYRLLLIAPLCLTLAEPFFKSLLRRSRRKRTSPAPSEHQ